MSADSYSMALYRCDLNPLRGRAILLYSDHNYCLALQPTVFICGSSPMMLGWNALERQVYYNFKIYKKNSWALHFPEMWVWFVLFYVPRVSVRKWPMRWSRTHSQKSLLWGTRTSTTIATQAARCSFLPSQSYRTLIRLSHYNSFSWFFSPIRISFSGWSL